MRIQDVTDGQGRVADPEWLARAEGVHRQLRTHLPADYATKMARVFAQGGRMCLAVDGDRVLGVAVYRVHENTADGLKLYVDDLVTAEDARSQGVGRALLGHLERVARDRGCQWLCLDSGTQRHRAHAFYFREGMSVASFAFRKAL